VLTALAAAASAVATARVGPAQAIEADAERLLADASASFSALGDLADRLQPEMARSGRPPDVRGRLILLWVRAMRRALAAIPITVDGTAQEPYRRWLAAHEQDIFYAQPAGEWKFQQERLWALHDAIRATPSAEPLAWEIVENGLGGECEGYPPCYPAGIDLLEGEYLRRHPRGAHAAEAVARITASNQQSVALMTGPDRRDFFNPATDCVDLVPKARVVRAALGQAGVDTAQAVALLDMLRQQCP
jgi:hypothetical protein